MQLRTFGNWTGSISGIGAGALTASPDYQFLAPYLALASAAVWAAMLIWFLIYNRGEIRSGVAKLGSWYFILPCLALGVVAIASAAYGLGLKSSASAEQTAKQEPTPQKVVYLKDVQIRTSHGMPWVNPRFVAKFTRSGQRARLFVEERYYVAGVMGQSGWIHAPQVQLSEFKDFVAGQQIDVEMLTPFDNDSVRLWRWGPPTEKPDPKTTFQSHAWHQGRLVFLVDREAPEYFYFIIDISSPDAMPNVIGKERFEFAEKWETEDAKN